MFSPFNGFLMMVLFLRVQLAQQSSEAGVHLWIGEGEDMARLKTMHGIDPSCYKIFRQGEKKFDLGGGRIVDK